jgi:colanic acid/amylovoran biosynthesis glycosyltransferase
MTLDVLSDQPRAQLSQASPLLAAPDAAKLRVLHAFDYYLSTTTNWMFNLIRHVPDCHVVIAAERFGRCNFYPSRFDYVEFPFKPLDLSTSNFSVRIFNWLAKHAISIYPYFVSRNAGRVDLVHSHFSYVGWRFRKVPARLNVPHIISFYGGDYEYMPTVNPVWRVRYSDLFRDADLFLCEGPHGAKLLKRSGCPAEKIHVARLGVEVGAIPFFERRKLPGELQLLQIASITEKKGHVHTVEAFVRTLRTCPNMTLTIVGREAARERSGILARLEQTVRGTKAEGKVTFLNEIDFSCLHHYMKHFQVFIHPSCYSQRRDCEGGAPIVLLDAQATGMPVISTRHCDIPDEVVHGKGGLLSEEGDVGQLEAAIAKFYWMGQQEYSAFSLFGRRHVQENYDIASNAAHLGNIYRSLILRRK